MAVIDVAGYVADLKDHSDHHGFHVHDERHFVETYSLRQTWEVDLHPEEGCGGPLDLHLALEVDPRTLLSFEDAVVDLPEDAEPPDEYHFPLTFTWGLPPLPHGPDLLRLAIDLAGVGGIDLPLEVSAIDSFASATDAPERRLSIVARYPVSLARVLGGEELLVRGLRPLPGGQPVPARRRPGLARRMTCRRSTRRGPRRRERHGLPAPGAPRWRWARWRCSRSAWPAAPATTGPTWPARPAGTWSGRITLYQASLHAPTRPQAAAQQSQAVTELRDALPLASIAAGEAGQYQALMATLAESDHLPESLLVHALGEQCAAADSATGVAPTPPPTAAHRRRAHPPPGSEPDVGRRGLRFPRRDTGARRPRCTHTRCLDRTPEQIRDDHARRVTRPEMRLRPRG